MFNKVILVGNCTKNGELKHLQSGTDTYSNSIACSREWKDKLTGEKKQETMFIDFKCYSKLASIAHQYLLKGKKVLVEGRLVLEQWTDSQNGQKRSKHVLSVESLQFLDSKSADTEPQSEQDEYPAHQIPGVSDKPQNRQIDEESDIPFSRG